QSRRHTTRTGRPTALADDREAQPPGGRAPLRLAFTVIGISVLTIPPVRSRSSSVTSPCSDRTNEARITSHPAESQAQPWRATRRRDHAPRSPRLLRRGGGRRDHTARQRRRVAATGPAAADDG